jgi:serine/threonine protein kinase
VIALEYLHARGVLFRDLKTENILFNSDGHIRLIDFGVSKGNLDPQNNGRSKTQVHGTLEYLAPEMLNGAKEYGFEVDWYALGLVIYEMLTGGEHPFKVGEPQSPHYKKAVAKRIKEGTVKMKPYFSPNCESLLKGLLDTNPERRLGCGIGGVSEIKNHPFFSTINWSDIENHCVNPPYEPPVKDDLDTCLIDKEFMNEAVDNDMVSDVEPTEDEINLEKEYSIPRFVYINKDELHRLMARQAH